MPKVSVIIPTYNRADKIFRAVNSVLKQTFKDFELIIVDDCSTDNTKDVVNCIQDNRIKYIILDKNCGAGTARNVGVSAAIGEFIAFHDSDDEWRENKLELQVEYMEKFMNYGMVYCKMHIVTAESSGDFPNSDITGELEGNIYSWLLQRNTIGAPTMFIRKKCFNEIGGFDESLRCLEDWELAVRFAEKFNIGYIDEPLINVYSEPGGVSSNIGGYYEARCKMIVKNKDRLEKMGMLDDLIMDVFVRAEARGILTLVQSMMIKMLQEY